MCRQNRTGGRNDGGLSMDSPRGLAIVVNHDLHRQRNVAPRRRDAHTEPTECVGRADPGKERRNKQLCG